MQELSGKPGGFRPPLRELFIELEWNPEQFEEKHRDLAGCRAAPVRYDRANQWRCVFEIDQDAHVVTVYSLDQHDVAYEKAVLRRSSA